MCWSDPQMLVVTVRRIAPCGTLRPTLIGLTPGPSLSSKVGYSVSITSTTPGPLYATALLFIAESFACEISVGFCLAFRIVTGETSGCQGFGVSWVTLRAA